MLNKDTPIRKKLMSAILLTCGAVSLLTYLSFFAYEYITFRHSLVNQLSSVGEIIAANSTAALAFDDNESAYETLSALQARPNIIAAALYDSDGHLFSKYPSTLSDSSLPARPEKPGYHFKESHLAGFQPVIQNGQYHGSIYLKSDMKALYERLSLYGLIVIVVIVGTFLLAFILSRRLQQRISEPILALAETAKAISDRRDYSVRAVKMGEDEIGLLTDAFNHMVLEIQKQNSEIILFNKQLEQHRHELQNIMDHSPDVICTVDEENAFVKVSDASAVVWGYQPEELIGTTATGLIYKEDQEISAEAENEIKQGIKTNFENRLVRKDGKIIPFIWSARWNEQEKVMYCVARDATAIKEAEYQLQQRAKELAASNAELEQFAYIASHDLQEPLRMVTSFLTQLEKKYKDQLDDKAHQYIYFAVDGAVRMRRIILDLLEYSRVGKSKYEVEEINLTELLTEIIRFSQPVIAEKRANVVFKNLPVIFAARTPLQQVLQNLINNALKYQPANGTPMITVACKETSNYWKFSVADNGIGIDPQFFNKIFVAFQRLHNNTEYSGTGIGLAICKKIIENHGGELWVDSIPGEGSTFWFTIKKNAGLDT